MVWKNVYVSVWLGCTSITGHSSTPPKWQLWLQSCDSIVKTALVATIIFNRCPVLLTFKNSLFIWLFCTLRQLNLKYRRSIIFLHIKFHWHSLQNVCLNVSICSNLLCITNMVFINWVMFIFEVLIFFIMKTQQPTFYLQENTFPLFYKISFNYSTYQ